MRWRPGVVLRGPRRMGRAFVSCVGISSAGKSILTAVLLALVSLVCFQHSASAGLQVGGRRTALVIGNSDYQLLPKLPNGVNDANRVRDILKSANFDVVLGENLDGKGMEKTIRNFLRSLNEGDIALFYYSGHAAQVAGENYIFPIDASLKSSYDLEVEAYNIGNLLEYMRQSSSMQIAILDSCRDNPFRNGFYYSGKKKVEVAGSQGLAAPLPGLGSLIVYSTAPDQAAYDGSGSVSPFTGSFAANALKPNTEVRDLITQVRTEVMSKTKGRQVPWDVSSLTEPFYFVKAQELLVVQDTTDISLPANVASKVRLNIPAPLASENTALSVRFTRIPKRGALWVGSEQVDMTFEVTPKQLSEVEYEPDAADRSPQRVEYVVTTNDGRTARSKVNISFTADAPPVEEEIPVASEQDSKPIQLAMAVDVGTGFTSISDGSLADVPSNDEWLRVTGRAEGLLVALGGDVVSDGDLIKRGDLGRLAIRPSLTSAGEDLAVTLRPVDTATKPVAITVAASINKCDQLASEPFDVQSVTEGVLPNEIDVPRALAACKAAVSQYPDVARFAYQYGRALYASGDFDDALRQFRAAYDKGHVRAASMLGRLYQLGVGVERDPAKAVPLFEAGTKKGDPYAQYRLAKALIQGQGVEVDVDRGMKLLISAGEAGHTYALNQLGFEYRNGEHTAQDLPRAVSFFQKSVARGDVWGMVNLGLLYRDGKGLDKDTQRALDLFMQAEKGGQPEAGTLIGTLLLDGGTASLKEIAGWYRKSAYLGQAWSALTAADFIAAHRDLAADPGEAIRYYALAASLNSGDLSERARTALAGLSEEAIALEIQNTLSRMGQGIVGKTDGKVSDVVRKAAAVALGGPAPEHPVDMLVQLIRKEWIASKPRLDML